MPNYSLYHTLTATNRRDIREEITRLFLNESPGQGTGELASKYEYEVESFMEYKIILKRPAILNFGFDFVVNVYYASPLFSNNKQPYSPSHKDVIEALQYNKDNHNNTYSEVQTILRQLYDCENIGFASNTLGYFRDHQNRAHPIEVILLAVKWLFIEQDITYWNYSGRQKLWGELCSNELV